MRKRENGYIVVETITSFTLFILLVVSILSLVNITVVQARVHYALTQAAQTLSMYSYVLHATGAAEHMGNLAQGAAGVQGEMDELGENLSGLLDGLESLSVSQAGASGEALTGQAGSWISDAAAAPKAVLQQLAQYGLYEGEKYLFGQVAAPLVERYLSNGSASGDEFLRAFHVIDGMDGLVFSDLDLQDNDSTLLDEDGNVVLTVRYAIDYTFGALPLPFPDHRLEITQTVKTKAWLGGNGEGYS